MKKPYKKFASALPLMGIIATGVLARFIPHPPNFTPIGGLAVFSGAMIAHPAGILIPLFVMFFSDLVIGLHPAIPYVYLSFLLSALLGKKMQSQKGFIRLMAASVLSSVLFFIITNFGAWLTWDFYPKTPSGLLNSYLMAVPFFRNTFLGDLFYNMLFFFGYRILSHLITKRYIIAEEKDY